MQLPYPVIGPYRLVGQIGEGGMGTVYEAVHQAIERRVAIKILKSEFAKDSEILARFFNEARAVNRIAHPSLVQISDYGQTPEGAIYLVMEFLEGDTLQQRLLGLEKSGQRLSLAELLQTIWQVAQALSAAHDKGVVHRDIKTDNIVLVRDPAVATGERAKIVDFGIAKLLQVSHKLTVLPRTMGSVLYMSPEQCRGVPDIDGRTDVYALGVIFYRGLTGRTPFDGDSLEAIIGQHFFVEPAPLAVQLPQVPREVTVLAHRMLLKDRNQRPTMHEVVHVVGELLAHPQVRSGKPCGAAVAQSAQSAGGPVLPSSSTISRSMGQSMLRSQLGSRIRPTALVLAGLGVAVAALGGRAILRPPSSGQPVQPATIAPVENVAPAPARQSASLPVAAPPAAPDARPGGLVSYPPRPAVNPAQGARPTASAPKTEPHHAPTLHPVHPAQRSPSVLSSAAASVSANSASSQPRPPANPKKPKPNEKTENLDFFKFGR